MIRVRVIAIHLNTGSAMPAIWLRRVWNTQEHVSFQSLNCGTAHRTDGRPMVPLHASTKKGDKYFAQGRVHEAKKEWDAALEVYEKALSEDPRK